MNDSELVEGLHRQDPVAIRQLSECLLPSIWRSVYVRVRGDRHLAEDIVSESVLRLLKAVAESACDIQSPSAWLRTVAINKVRDHFRAAARVQHLIDQAASVSSIRPEPQPSSVEELNEERLAVRRVMDDLPEQYRLVLEWKYIDHLSVRQIGDRLAITEKAAESILFRARREFREGLGRGDADEFPFPVINNGKRCGEGSAEASSPLKKGTVPLGNIELPRKDHQLERDSPLFQQPANGQVGVNGQVAGDARIEVEAPRSADFDELRQPRS